MKISFFSLASGSSGNCYFLGTEKTKILIDAGIGVRSIKRILRSKGLEFDDLNGVLITHDHTDHVKSASYLGEKLGIPVYATNKIVEGINRNYCSTIKLGAGRRIIEKNTPFEIGEMQIEAFDVPHDGTDNVGYFIRLGKVAFVVATDVGYITDEISSYLQRGNYIVVEANYDKRMLEMGRYPQHLKERIKGANGHLCNDETADFFAKCYSPAMKQIWLCHLSKDNNRPEIAYHAVEQALRGIGVEVGKDVGLSALARMSVSGECDINC